MKSWILLILLAVGLSAAATVAVPMLSGSSSITGPAFVAPVAPASDGPTPAAEIEGDLTYKFGVMAQDTDGVHSWVFKNAGAGMLELRNMGTDCSCTIIQLKKPGPEGETDGSGLAIKPGATESIDIKWNTRKGDGPYRKSARIGTNDPNRPEITLVVEGTVRPAITIVPGESAVNFQSVSNDEPSKRSLAVFSADRPEMKLTRLASSDPGLIGVESRPLNPEECKQVKAEKGYAVDVTLKQGSKLGSFAEEILMETDHPLKKEVRIPVLGRVTGPITSMPEKVVLRDVSSSNGGGLDLTLWARGQSAVKFEVASKPESLDVAIEPIPQPAGAKGSKYRMAVKVIPGVPAGPIQGDILLKTDHPQASEVRVPVDILVQGSN